MNIPKTFALGAVGLLAVASAAVARNYPTRPVTMVVPFAAGARPISWPA